MNGESWPPDDPRWLTVPPQVECYDTKVFEMVGVPRAFLELAKRRCTPAALAPAGTRTLVSHHSRGFPDLSFLDELREDPDTRPYTWDLPEDCY